MKKFFIGFISLVLIVYISLIVYAYAPYKTNPVAAYADKDSRFIQVHDHTIHFIKKGEGAPLILVHGFGGSIYTWRKLIPLLSQYYTVYALDLPGFGLSDKPPDGDYHLQAQADVVLGFCKALQIPAATLIGHSMGGVVVSYAAVKEPELVKNIVLIEPGFYHGSAPAFLRYLFFPLQRVMAKSFYTKNGRLRSLMGSYYNKSIVTDEVLEAYLLAAKTPHAIDALANMMLNAGDESYEGLSTSITSPTLLVWSKNNKNNPLQDGERLQREIKGSRLVIVDQSGHYVQEEKPEELATFIKEYVH